MSETAGGNDMFAGYDLGAADEQLAGSYKEVRAELGDTLQEVEQLANAQNQYVGVEATFGDDASPAALTLSCGQMEFSDGHNGRETTHGLVVHGRVGEQLYAIGTGYAGADAETIEAVGRLVEEAAQNATEEQASWLREVYAEAQAVHPDTLAHAVDRLASEAAPFARVEWAQGTVHRMFNNGAALRGDWLFGTPSFENSRPGEALVRTLMLQEASGKEYAYTLAADGTETLDIRTPATQTDTETALASQHSVGEHGYAAAPLPPQNQPMVAAPPADAKFTEDFAQHLAHREAPVDARLSFMEEQQDRGVMDLEIGLAEFNAALQAAMESGVAPAPEMVGVAATAETVSLAIGPAPLAPAMGLPPAIPM